MSKRAGCGVFGVQGRLGVTVKVIDEGFKLVEGVGARIGVVGT